jgi:hypothetical protein
MSRSTKLKIVGPFCVIAGIVMVVQGFKDKGVAARLEKEGITVPARAVDHRVVSGRRGSKTYKIVAEYEAKDGGPTLSKEFKVPRSAYEASEQGGPIQVRYLPSDPTVSEVAGAGSDGSEPIAIGTVMAIIGAGMSFVAFRKKAEAVPQPQAPAA